MTDETAEFVYLMEAKVKYSVCKILIIFIIHIHTNNKYCR